MSNNINNFKDIHLNEDIYVIGSGSSCNWIDNSFFEKKITIGINQVYKKYKTNYLIRKDPNLINESIRVSSNDTIIFISKGEFGHINNNKNKEYIQKHYNKSNKIIIFDHNHNPSKNGLKKEIINNLKEDNLLVSYSTITTGIYLAYYMGAKNIILVGHDCGTINNLSNFNDDFKVEYGIDTKKINITNIILSKCLKNNKIIIPTNDVKRKNLFNIDPCPKIVKSIYINGKIYNANEEINIDAPLNYHTNKTMAQNSKQEYINWLKGIEKDTIVLKNFLKEKNCNVHSLNPFVSFRLEGNTFK